MLIANDSIDIMDRDIGIYKIYCKENNMVYIGQSNQIGQRWKSHKNDLINNKHHNNLLQEDFNKFGELAFDFEIIHLAEIETLNMLEGFYMNLYKDRSYNIKNADGSKYVKDKELTVEEFMLLKKFKAEKDIKLEAVRKYMMLLDFIEFKYSIVEYEYVGNMMKSKKYKDDMLFDLEKAIVLDEYIGPNASERLLKAKLYSVLVLAYNLVLNRIGTVFFQYRGLLKIKINNNKSKFSEGRLVLNCTVMKTDEMFEKVLYF